MKVKQIVSEIKKGAKDSNGVGKCWPGKHAEGTKKGKNGGQVRNCVPNESIEVKPMPGASQVVSDGKPIATTDAATAQAIAKAAGEGNFNPTDGADKPALETNSDVGPVGGDPTDEYIQDITADEGMFDAPTNPQIEALKAMLADPKYASNPMAKSQLEKRLKIAQDRASLDQGQAMGAGGSPKPVLDPDAFSKANPNFKETQSAVYPSRNPGTPAANAAAQAATQPAQHQSVMPSRNKIQEADDVLLGKMLAIAGLR